ncbi:uncharacterized protein FA14DRAFT_190189 [Meira miltonrushii]|uniref:DUF2985 domain-containing protein n=1 Tax=Meira miltonrushii TaxID=1280837 RepID=A0A316VJ19_9BASI|nr:uncharacterized protein FA14DRAFT_190189 [Meira miltonrushii]PWN36293.1 hypothetical protein FA14DRAFT_190189 [Meira miltonrushii]
MSAGKPDNGRPRIPSNLRIRRGSSYSAAVVSRDTLDDEAGAFNPERRGSEGMIGGETLRMQQTNNSQLNGSPKRSTGRRLGVIEELARQDRIANAQRSTNYADPSRQDASTSSNMLASEQPYFQNRPKITTKPSNTRLPAVAEVASPAEQSEISLPNMSGYLTPNTGALRSAETGNYFAHPNTSTSAVTEKDTLSNLPTPASNGRPTLSNSISMPPERHENQLEGFDLKISKDSKATKDDSFVPDGGGRLARMPSDIPEISPNLQKVATPPEDREHHEAEVADYLDVIDAEVGTLGFLTNVQNSIFVPNIPGLYDRRPVHDLPGARKRSSTITSLAKRVHDNRRSSLIDSAASHDRASITSDLEQGQGNGRASALGAATGFTGGEKPSRPPTRTMLSRMTSAVTFKRKITPEEEAEYAKHIKEWRDMDEEERDELDEHVRLVLSKKSKFHRGLKGFWAFVKTPMGFIMTLYGFLITFWGTAIMLFIWNWIHVGERRRYWIEICDQILCALFAAVGLGFAPFRAVDTYRMIWIAKMHYRTWERRKELGLNDLQDKNDLPRPDEDGSNQVSRVVTAQHAPTHSSAGRSAKSSRDIESTAGSSDATPGKQPKHWWDLKHDKSTSPGRTNLISPQSSHSSDSYVRRSKKHKGHFVVPNKESSTPVDEEGDANDDGANLKQDANKQPVLKRNESIQSELIKEREEVVVLTKEEQAILEHHQRKFHASHTFYRFHETSTHRAFPLDLMMTIVCLLDCHSMLQGALGGCTWGIKYTHRPTALTATLITCSLSCNAMAGLLIYIGGRKTKKREEVERRLKIALEAMALAKIERRRARGELPDRQHEGSKGSNTPPNKDSDSSTNGEEANQIELRQAVDNAARETEDVDQAPYDEPETTLSRERTSLSHSMDAKEAFKGSL